MQLAFALNPSQTLHVFDDETLARLGRLCEVHSPEPLREFSSDAARKILAETDVLVTAWGCPRISSEVLASAPRLRLIAHAAGTVKPFIDQAVYERGVVVSNAVDANAIPVAEFTLAAIIMANKQVLRFRDLYRDDHKRASSHALMDEPIGNFRRTVGIIGASRIGRRVIGLLQNLDCTVLLYDPYVSADDPLTDHVELVDLDTLMARSDVVSLHAPSLPSTRGMIGAGSSSSCATGQPSSTRRAACSSMRLPWWLSFKRGASRRRLTSPIPRSHRTTRRCITCPMCC